MRNLFFILTILVFLFSSCGSPKRITYVNDMVPYKDYPVTQRNEIKIQEGDRLRISVDAKNPELALPFNVNQGTIMISEGGYAESSTKFREVEKGYVVDAKGDINFPILGKLQAIGLTHLQLADLIKNRLIRNNLIKDPIVNVELLNLKILMIGESSNQIITSPDNKITILEAIGQGGGISSNGIMNEVAVIREERGVRQMYLVDMNSTSLFDSPVYYLQQHDIVYVKPSSAPLPTRFNQIWQNVSLITGFASLIVSLLILSKY